MKVALLGATGQLGVDVMKAAKALDISCTGLGHDRVEITDYTSVLKALEDTDADVVINAAAFHQVDKCEDEPGQAFAVNAVGALHASRAARAIGARVVYVSTDYVFDGGRSTSWRESDSPRPLNTYGASKLAGEHETHLSGRNEALVCRVSSLFGASGARGKGGNFVETILKRAKEGGPLKVVNDQWMTPTYTLDAGDAILRLARQRATGIVNVTNGPPTTWHAFASEAVRLCGIDVPVEPVPAATYASKAQRPMNSALATDKLAALLGEPLRRWPEALAAYLEEKGHI